MKKKYWICPVLCIVLFGLILIPAYTPSFAAQPKQKTVTIGLIGFLGWPMGLDMMRGVELMADMDNKKGGLNIGGEKYQVKLIQYDSKNDQATTVAAANRLIFRDKVKFIIADSRFVDAWPPIADKNKVIAVVQAVSQEAESPKYKYVFDGAAMNAQNCVLTGWFAKTYPDKKHIAIALPDTQMGHAQFPTTQASLEAFGMEATGVFYPESQQDQSALGTKIKIMNPDGFMAIAGGPVNDGLCYKAAYQAGYRGQFFANHAAPFQALAQVIPAEALEGFINMAWAVEFDNPPTEQARAFKKAWIEKYGKWDAPDIHNTANYACIRAALEKAGSLDVDKVADAISSGLKFEGPTAKFEMIDRPDLGNNRTVDSIASYYFKEVKGGKPVEIYNVSFDEALTYFREAFK